MKLRSVETVAAVAFKEYDTKGSGVVTKERTNSTLIKTGASQGIFKSGHDLAKDIRDAVKRGGGRARAYRHQVDLPPLSKSKFYDIARENLLSV